MPLSLLPTLSKCGDNWDIICLWCPFFHLYDRHRLFLFRELLSSYSSRCFKAKSEIVPDTACHQVNTDTLCSPRFTDRALLFLLPHPLLRLFPQFLFLFLFPPFFLSSVLFKLLSHGFFLLLLLPPSLDSFVFFASFPQSPPRYSLLFFSFCSSSFYFL